MMMNFKVGSVSSLLSRSSSSEIALFHISSVPGPWHRQTWAESSGSPHLGQASVCHSFHLCMNFPTPHIPDTCFVINILLVQCSNFMVRPIAFQSTRETPAGSMSFFFPVPLAVFSLNRLIYCRLDIFCNLSPFYPQLPWFAYNIIMPGRRSSHW
jgi:hypothetical protein